MIESQKTNASGFDLSQLDTTELANKGIEVTIYNPKNNEDTDIKIRILGQDSDAFRKFQRKSAARNLGAMLKSGPRREQKMLENAEETVVDQLVETTVGWSGILRDGQPLEFNKANAAWLYEHFPLIRDQVLEAQRERANFLGS